MKDGDIINFLEAHNVVDIGCKLSNAQIENILKMLFDKKDIDVSVLSERDLEIAFLKLPEENQRAVLMEMGLTRQQISTIMAEIADLKAGKKGVAGKVVGGIAKILKDVLEKAKEDVSNKIEETDNSKEELPEWYGKPMQLDGTSEQEIYLNKRLSSLTQIPWNQEKVDELWNACELIYDEYGIQIDPRMLLAIIIQEGTGSFNTSSDNKAADGGNGPQEDYATDLMNANNLLFGKILGYMYYCDEFETAIANSSELNGQGGIFDYMNWDTPIVRIDSGNVEVGVYAEHSAWGDGIESIYEKLTYDGATEDYTEYVKNIEKTKIQEIVGDVCFPEYTFVPDQDGKDSEGIDNHTWTINAE